MNWKRVMIGQRPVYICTENAHWFVPNTAGDKLLQSKIAELHPENKRFFSRIPEIQAHSYPGRSALLNLEKLNELWLHITNRCNLTCSHCLFSSSPSDALELSMNDIISFANEAYDAGCRMFALTGGEPFMHPDIDSIITLLLKRPESHVAVLTNGMIIRPFLERHTPDPDYFHLQISVDGLEENHDAIRGKGAFKALTKVLDYLKARPYPYTLSMSINRQNAGDMSDIIDFAANHGAQNVHFMWYFIRGRGQQSDFADTDLLFDNLVRAAKRSEELAIPIDNLESLKTQIFSPPGTIHDGSTSGWESLAVGPDARLYPSAALVGLPELATAMIKGLIHAWKTSPILEKIRQSTMAHHEHLFRFFLGGGDIDHSYIHNGTFSGDDPYLPLYEKLALWLIDKEVSIYPEPSEPKIMLRMGDILESCGAHGEVALLHSNCLLATAQNNSLTIVKNFYSQAVGDNNEDILNPVCYEPSLLKHIPEKYRFRGYGCGSPVMDAAISESEALVDLGCGSGVECFIASSLTGKNGRITGVDMLDPMLSLAREGLAQVEKNLGYGNIAFLKGYLEDLPVPDDSTDVVTSNCVMNLSVNKRKAFAEIFRILKPGGRLVISDVVCETEPGPAIRNDETLKGECIAGSLTEAHLTDLLETTGFTSIYFIKRFIYRKVQGHPFYSLTYRAVKPRMDEKVRAMYRGPLPSIYTDRGTELIKGNITDIDAHEADLLGDQIFILDKHGHVLNVETENTCACFKPAEAESISKKPQHTSQPIPIKQPSGCMYCGKPLVYQSIEEDRTCTFCGSVYLSNSVCESGHFVCDHCHAENGLDIIRQVCLNTKETDMIRLFERIRQHPSIPVHGPEYHAMIPGIILSTYKNRGGAVTSEIIETGIKRGSTIAGGFCGFMGICGAAVGVGIAFSLITEATPLKAEERQIIQTVTHKVLKEIADQKAARCCQREGWIALKKCAELSKNMLPVSLKADADLNCRQQNRNRQCMGKECPLFGSLGNEDILSPKLTLL